MITRYLSAEEQRHEAPHDQRAAATHDVYRGDQSHGSKKAVRQLVVP